MRLTKQRILFILILFGGLLFIAACSSDNPNTSDVDNESPEKDDEEVENPEEGSSEEPVTLPEEVLHKSNTGDMVTALQHILIEIGYPIEVTGTYDEETTWAITDFQLQHEALNATGIYESETKSEIKQILEGGNQVESGENLSKPTNNQAEKKSELGNPYDVLALINKVNLLPADYYPEDLTVPNVRFSFDGDDPKKQLRKVAADAIEELFAAADEAGLELFALSGFRSYDRQDAIFAANAQKHGEEHANTFSARPGESEHQSGLAMDVTSPAVNYDLVIEFGETAEGKWLAENASKFGFIIRFLEGKEDITQYQYEPWHLRYVGVEVAKEVMDQGITLEEYFANKE